MKNFMFFMGIVITIPVPLISAVILLVWVSQSDWMRKETEVRERNEVLMDRVAKDYAEKDAEKKANEVPFWRAREEKQ